MGMEKHLVTKISRRDFLKDSACATTGMLAAGLPMESSVGQDSKAQLSDISGGEVWMSPDSKLRIKFVGDITKGYDVAFQSKVEGAWQTVAAFPEGKVWAVYNEWDTRQWDPRWYGGEHGFKVLQIVSHSE